MFPARSSFRTSIAGDGWFINRSSVGNAAGENDDICQASGGFFLAALSMFMRLKMRTDKTRNPYIIEGVRFSTDAIIDLYFLNPTAWTRKLLLAYNEFLHRSNNTSARQYIETGAVTRDFLTKLINGGIMQASTSAYVFLPATGWLGRMSDTPPTGVLNIIPEDALMPVIGEAVLSRPWPVLSTGCTGRGNLDSSYIHPSQRSQQSDNFTAIALGLGIAVLLSMANRQ